MGMTKLAKVAYEAYCESCGGFSVRGDQLPKWELLPDKIKLHWEHTVTVVKKQIFEDMADDGK